MGPVLRSDCPIVVADDDPSILGVVCEALTLDGYPVLAATNGQEALTSILALHERCPDCPPLVFLDMRMPVLSGWEVAEALRRQAIDVPIIVMTAAQNARTWADEIAAAGVLAKPFDLDALFGELERILALRDGDD